MTKVESIRNYIADCPALENLGAIAVDYLTEKGNVFSIEPSPNQPLARTYINGDTERQFVFVFAARFPYSDELMNNIDNTGFFEDFSDWIFEKNLKKELPVLDNGEATKIEIISAPHLSGVANDITTARYEITLTLIYDMEV